MTLQASRFDRTITHKVGLSYTLYQPAPDPAIERWPLVIFLHGFGERGTDLSLLDLHGPTKLIRAGQNFPFMLIAPQCPIPSWWPLETESLRALVDHALNAYPVDPDRVYLTGLSMGGYGTWHFAIEHPHLFAAIAPICGGGIPALGDRLVHLPIWAFHGAKDDVVPLSDSERMVNGIRNHGGEPRLTVYPEADHDSWSITYENPEFWAWLLEQRRPSR